MNSLNPLLAALVLWGTLPARAQFPDLAKNPAIFIAIDAKHPDLLTIDGACFKREEAPKLLREYTDKFGDKDPVVVVADREVPLGLAADTVRMARVTHPAVYGVIKAYAIEEPVLLFDMGPISNPRLLINYLISMENHVPGMILPSNDGRALYIPPPDELKEQLATPAAK